MNRAFKARPFLQTPEAAVRCSASAATIVRHLEPLIIVPGRVFILHAFFTGVTPRPQFEPIIPTIEH